MTIKRARIQLGRDALQRYAEYASPQTEIPHRVYLAHSTTCIAIHDRYPKSRYHFVLFPRVPFTVPASTNSTTEDTIPEICPSTKLTSLRALATFERATVVLEQLRILADDVVQIIHEDMNALYGRSWPIQVGFHANESMPHLHCHVISQDFAGEWMKKVKHWNSFRPDGGFFVQLDRCIEYSRAGQLNAKLPSKKVADALLGEALRCHHRGCASAFSHMEALREHLHMHFDMLLETAGNGNYSATEEDK